MITEVSGWRAVGEVDGGGGVVGLRIWVQERKRGGKGRVGGVERLGREWERLLGGGGWKVAEERG